MSKRVLLSLFLIVVICLGGLAIGGLRTTENASAETMCGRTVFADVVALDQDFYYNRLGAINANGMIYALARDVVVNDPAPAGFTAGQPLSDSTNPNVMVGGPGFFACGQTAASHRPPHECRQRGQSR